MRTTKRHQLLTALVAAGVLLLGACAGESPTAPTGGTPPGGGTPPPVGASITLAASNESPLVQSTTTITATVTENGQPVPNGTAVEFETNLGSFADTGGTTSIRTTTNGVATVVLTSPTAGTARVTARVNNVIAQKDITFRSQPTTPPPIVTSISSISPTRGGPAGGQEVIIRGQNFKSPVRVLFGTKPAASVLISATEIRAVSPSTNLGPSTQFEEVDVIVISEAGTPTEQSATAPQKFRYELEILQPAITTVSPSSGPNEGNTRVTIFGEGFSAPIKVYFGTSGSPGAPLQDEVEAEVQGAPTFNQVVVLTPPALGLGTALANKQVTIRVLNVATGKDAVRNSIYRYGPSMQITAAGPTALSPFGGDRVEIEGWGFDDPVAVTLAGVAASPISVAGTKIVVLSGAPLIQACAFVGGAGNGPVSVTNVEDGVSDTGPTFAYALPNIRIQSVSPTTVTAGTTLTFTVSGVSGLGGRVTIGDKTVIPTQTSFAGGVGTYTFTVPSNLQFDTEACLGGSGAAPRPTDFDLKFEDQNGCSDELSGVLTVNPPNTGKLFLDPQSLALNTTVGTPTSDSFRIINVGAGSLTVSAVSGGGGAFTVGAPTLPQTLLSCGTIAVNVTYNPAAPGSSSTNVSVTSDGGNALVAVSGTATAPAPAP